MVVSSAGSIFQTANATKFLFIDGLLSTTFTVLCLFTGLFFFQNLNDVALLISVSFILNFFKSFFILFRFVLKQKISLFFKQLIIPVLSAFLLGIILYFTNIFMDCGLLFSLAIKSVISFFLTLTFLHFFKIYDLITFVKKQVYGKR
jgi:PST family polysaccharide transporter